MNAISSIAAFYKEGGPFMHAVLAIAIVIIAIVTERMIVIGRATSLNGRKLTDDLVRCVSRGDMTGARNIAQQSSAPAARVAQAMLHAQGSDEAGLHAAADDTATLTLPDLAKRLSTMAVLANSATLIGLLGTITGLIRAISGVGMADAAQRSAYLTAGISEALHTTAFGLMIAIPTLMIQGWLSSRVEGVSQDVDQVTVRLSQAMMHVTTTRGAGPVSLAKPAGAAAIPMRPATGTLGGGR
jgi:biopolymer transport protein ExbB